MNKPKATATLTTSVKRKQLEGNELPQKKREAAILSENNFNDIKHIEDIYNTILDVKNSLRAVYQETGLTMKNALESIDLHVPELNEEVPLLTVPTSEEPNPSSSQQEQLSQRLEPSSQNPTPPSHPENSSPLQSQPAEASSSPTSSTSSSDSRIVAKWTLKHQGPGLGLVELLPNTGIYVSEEELSRCNLIRTDMRKYGRLLLPVVFSKQALEKCSFTGRSMLNRPGLDEHAKNTFINYVTKHSRESGWAIVRRSDLIVSLSNKIRLLHRHYFKYSSVLVDF